MSDTANLDDQDTDKAPWTVKSVPVEVRKLAVASASKAGETMAIWLAKAVRNQANLEAGERILPPAPRSASGSASALSVVTPRPPVDMAGLADLMQAAVSAAQAAGVPLSKTVARQAMALTNAQLRQARGLPEKAPRQTGRRNGQTIEAEAA